MIRLGLVGHGRVAELAVCRPARGGAAVKVTAVAGRHPERAAAFAGAHAIPHAFDSYGAMLRADVVDAVYVCLPHHLHARAALDALAHARHVLVEKPLALTGEDAARVRRAQEAAGLTVLEAVMVQHHPWQAALRERVDSGAWGPVTAVETRIAFPLAAERIARLRGAELGGGVFCDVAPYWLQFLQTLAPLDVEHFEARGSFDGPGAADLAFSARLTLRGGVTATLAASYREPFAATHTVHCADATLVIPDFLRPMLGDYRVRMTVSRGAERETLGLAGGGYYENQLGAFASAIEAGAAPPSLAPSVERVAVMERLYRHACAAAGVAGP